MIQAQDLNFLKQAQIRNVILHNLSDLGELSAKGQFGFYDSDRRLYLFDGQNIKRVAYDTDVEENVSVYNQIDDPRGISENPLTKPAIWYNPSDNTIKMYNIDTNTWSTLTSDSTAKANIEEYDDSGDTTYPPLSVVIHENKIYWNTSGGDVFGVWKDQEWTNLGNTVDAADIRYEVISIPTTLADGSTSGIVTRSGNDYIINHDFNKDFPTVFCVEDSTMNMLDVGIEFTDADNVTIKLPIEIPFDFTVIIKE